MKNTESWFVAQRAESLAIVFLTQRKDLVVSRPLREDLGYDLLVHISDETLTPWIFAVEVKARQHSSPNTKPISISLSPSNVTLAYKSGIPFCLFFYLIGSEDEGYYVWLNEPVVNDNGEKGLVPIVDWVSNETARKQKTFRVNHLNKLDRYALDMIVEKVAKYYQTYSGE